MYGLLLGAFADAIIETYGEETWKQIKDKAGVQYGTFVTHTVYSETLQPRLVNATAAILSQKAEDVLMYQGEKFVDFCIRFGYDNFMRLLGRTLSDFFNGLDNLHEYFRQSYPEMKRVSFIVSEESRNGLILHYRSKRKGYKMYVKGQILSVAKLLFNTEVKIEVKEERLMDETTFVAFDVFFDNVDYQIRTRPSSKVNKLGLHVESRFIFSLFPFNIVFNRNMLITNVGNSLFQIMPDILNQPVDDVFKLVKPMTSLTWETLVAYENNSFELETIDCLAPRKQNHHGASSLSSGTCGDDVTDPKSSRVTMGKLLLRGQMLLVEEWDQFMFICTPVLSNVKQMLKCGLFINDLSLHDSTRAAVLAGSQQSNQLSAALQKAKDQSAALQDTMKRIDAEMARTGKFLQEMMPKTLADRIKKGEPVLSMTQSHESVSILFASIVNFPSYINESKPMNVIQLLNLVFSVYDQLVKSLNAYKVETVGDTYMVACGAPNVFEKHAEETADLALHMLHVANFIIPPGHEAPIAIKIGIHSGPVSTGVIGSRCPRFCFFGDTVNTASRMCSYSGANKVQISVSTKDILDQTGDYIFESRGTLSIKGKGDMITYYLLGTRKKLTFVEQLKVIVIQCMGKQQENQYQQILGKRTSSLEGNNATNGSSAHLIKRKSLVSVQETQLRSEKPSNPVQVETDQGTEIIIEDDESALTGKGEKPTGLSIIEKTERDLEIRAFQTVSTSREQPEQTAGESVKSNKASLTAASQPSIKPEAKQEPMPNLRAQAEASNRGGFEPDEEHEPTLKPTVSESKSATQPNSASDKTLKCDKPKSAGGRNKAEQALNAESSGGKTVQPKQKYDEIKCPVELFNISTQTVPESISSHKKMKKHEAKKKKPAPYSTATPSNVSSGRASPSHLNNNTRQKSGHVNPAFVENIQSVPGNPGSNYLMQCPMHQSFSPEVQFFPGWGMPTAMMSPDLHCPLFVMPNVAAQSTDNSAAGSVHGNNTSVDDSAHVNAPGIPVNSGFQPVYLTGTPQNFPAGLAQGFPQGFFVGVPQGFAPGVAPAFNPDRRMHKNSDGKDSGRSTDGERDSRDPGEAGGVSGHFVALDAYGQPYVKLVPTQSALCSIL